ncbi:hypothetical protein EJ110_NYTH00765 [Nymphaea thermarum]|nr:hypothetical protein EJ110_NYTH00765 [Nymphaea thermarum]
MERSTPVRKPHTSTADLLTWSETPLPDPAAGNAGTPASRSAARPHQPSGGVGAVLFGGQVTPEEAESLLKTKPCSESKLKEMTGSGIFVGEEDPESGSNLSNPTNKTGLRLYQQAINSISQISFSADGSVSPKKPTTLTEVAKQKELSGSLENESDAKINKQLSDAKSRELSGHDIFAGPAEIPPRSSAAHSLDPKEIKGVADSTPRHLQTSIKISSVGADQSVTEDNAGKTAKKIYNQKMAELTGNDIFKEEAVPSSAEKSLSVAKLREMSGSDIFADGKASSRDYLGGVRKPPGGESSIALV